MEISFRVHGEPRPQGSSRAFVVKGRAIVTSDNKKLKPWRQDISSIAAFAMQALNQSPIEGPVWVAVTFQFQKPKSMPKRVTEKITKPDLDKLLRAVLDGLTGHCFRDDAQVVRVSCRKEFGESAGAIIRLGELQDGA